MVLAAMRTVATELLPTVQGATVESERLPTEVKLHEK